MSLQSTTTNNIILDASALIALLADEKGQEIIIPLLPKAIMSSVNIAEVAKFLIESKNLAKEQASGIIKSLIEKIIPFDEELAFVSAAIVAQTKFIGLSLGDRACLALALQTNYPVYTADKVWAKLELNCQIVLIR